MQLAALTLISSKPTGASASADAISPAKVFEIAYRRVDEALNTFIPCDTELLPNAAQASAARIDAYAASRILRAAIVPTATPATKQRASAAISQLYDAAQQIRRYEHILAAVPADTPLRRDHIDPLLISAYGAARDCLLAAAATLG